MSDVNILVVDNDSASQHALQQVFGSEDCRVTVVPIANEALRELARGRWTLVVANVVLAEVTGPLFTILRDLAQAEQDATAGGKLLRVLFLVPGSAARWAQPVLERERLPYAMKPLHLHDFLAKVSDLLLETGAIPRPIREACLPARARERKFIDKRLQSERPCNQMFASRRDYMMTEEEIAEYEKHEEEDRKRRKDEEKRREFL